MLLLSVIVYAFLKILQVEYLLKKLSTTMNQEWDGKPLDALICFDPTGQDEGLSIWSFLEHMSAGHLLRVTNAEAFSLALDEVFLEMYHNVLKRVSPCLHITRLSLFVP